MKKIAFALYVFGLLIMFPLVAFLEMNHGSGVSSKVEETSTPVYNKILVKDETSTSTTNILLLKSNF
jgi:hypothetical protein